MKVTIAPMSSGSPMRTWRPLATMLLSASASEILAGALHEYGKATLIGEKSFGKGSVQEVIQITPDTSLKVTIARWLTPNGVSISDNGIMPDIVVPVSEDDIKNKKDPQLERAIEELLK